jgi:hypothetical protein
MTRVAWPLELDRRPLRTAEIKARDERIPRRTVRYAAGRHEERNAEFGRPQRPDTQ